MLDVDAPMFEGNHGTVRVISIGTLTFMFPIHSNWYDWLGIPKYKVSSYLKTFPNSFTLH